MDILGMGVTVTLRDMFSRVVPSIRQASGSLSNQVANDAKKMNQAYKLAGLGITGMLAGGGILAGMYHLGKTAVEKAADLEVFRNQFRSMLQDVKQGDALYNQSLKFAATTPFQIPEIMNATKMLTFYGFAAKDVGQQLQVAGNWAARMNVSIKETADVIGRVKSGGYSTAIRYLRSHGLNPALLRQAGAPLDAKLKLKPGSDPNLMVAAITKILENDPRFKGGMKDFMTTIPGMVSNMEDLVTIAMAGAGEKLKERVKRVLGGIQNELGQGGLSALFGAVGTGLDVVAAGLIKVLTPAGRFLKWLNELSKEHPGFVKWATVAVAVGASFLFLGGATLFLIGVYKAFALLAAGETFLAIAGAIGTALPMIAALAVAAVILYSAWKANVGGLADLISYWASNIWDVGKAVWELLSNIKNGVGTMSMDTADSLKSSGLFDVTVSLFMIFYRGYQVVMGVWDGFKWGIGVVGDLVGALLWLLTPVYVLVHWFGKLMGVELDAANAASPDKYKTLGKILGVVIAYMVVARTVTLLYAASQGVLAAVMGAVNLGSTLLMGKLGLLTIITKVVTGAQWLWNAAMAANPIGLICIAVLILIAEIVLLIVYWKQIHGWIMKAPTWLLVIIAFLNPMLGIPLLIIKYWTPIKHFFQWLGHGIAMIWNTVIDWIIDKFTSFTAWLLHAIVKLAQMVPSQMQGMIPGLDLIASINPDAITKDFLKSGLRGELTGTQIGNLLGTSPAVVTSAGAASTNSAVKAAGQGASSDKKPIVVHTKLELDGRQVGKAVTEYTRENGANGAE